MKWKREQATKELEHRSIQGECQESESSATAETGNGHQWTSTTTTTRAFTTTLALNP